MKTRITIIAFMALFLSAAAVAQAADNFHYGFKIGMASAKMSENETGLTESINDFYSGMNKHDGSVSGVNFGLVLAYDINDNFGYQWELNYVTRGMKVNFDLDEYVSTVHIIMTGSEEVKISYLEIPVLVKARVPVSPKISPGIFGGLAFAFEVSSKYDPEVKTIINAGTPGENTQNFSNNPDISNLNGTDFSLILGTDIKMDLGHTKLFFDMRYSIGLKQLLSNVNPDDIPTISTDFPDKFPIVNFDTGKAPDWNSRAWTFSLGILF